MHLLKNMAGLVLTLAYAIPASSQVVTTVGGNSSWGLILQVSYDASGNLYAGDLTNHVVYKVDHLGSTTVVAGTMGKAGYSGDGAAATSATLNSPVGTAVGADGSLYIGDFGNRRIRKVAPNGIITTFAGTGVQGFSGDGGAATNSTNYGPYTMTFDSKGVLYFVDWGNHRIRKIGTDGIITTVAGSGPTAYAGDGGLGPSANIFPGWLAVGGDGTVYFNDDGPYGYSGNFRVRKVSPNGIVSTVAGNGMSGYTGDGGPAISAETTGATGVTVDASGNVYFAEYGGARIRRVAPNGIITTWAGTGKAGNSGDGGPALSAQFNGPTGLTSDAQGNIYLADSANRKIRKIAPAVLPVISSGGIVPVYSSATTIQSGSWVSIYGTGLAGNTTIWNGDFPTSLGGTSVTIDSKPAYLWFVSPTQINLQVPDDAATGTVSVVVTTTTGSFTSSVTLGQYAPSFSLFNSTYAAALVVTPGSPGNSGAGYDYIGPSGVFSFPARPVKAGETLLLYGVGFGPTTIPVHAGAVFSGAAPCVNLPTVTIGGVPATVSFAGIIQAGLFQFNVVVPNAGSGDKLLQAMAGGMSTPAKVMITLQ